VTDAATPTMRTVRFHAFGEPAEVLILEMTEPPEPGPGRVRVRVHACGLAPADWALCRGLFPGSLPRGIGCDVSGTVDALGDGVDDVAIGDAVFGTADFAGGPSAGAADLALMDHWFAMPAGLDFNAAAALPMALETASLHLGQFGPLDGRTVLINGAGGTVGFAAVQIALHHGARVIATAGETFGPQLRAAGAEVTPYGEGVVERVRGLTGGPVDVVLDTAPIGGALPGLLELAAGDRQRVMTISDFEAAKELGVRHTFGEMRYKRYSAFPEFAQLAAHGRFSVPIAQTFALDRWRDALTLSASGHPRGKLLLIP
jgi:NADPH:quinone reductase-like Zn-dependent oxidoreductase